MQGSRNESTVIHCNRSQNCRGSTVEIRGLVIDSTKKRTRRDKPQNSSRMDPQPPAMSRIRGDEDEDGRVVVTEVAHVSRRWIRRAASRRARCASARAPSRRSTRPSTRKRASRSPGTSSGSTSSTRPTLARLPLRSTFCAGYGMITSL